MVVYLGAYIHAFVFYLIFYFMGIVFCQIPSKVFKSFVSD